MGAIAAGVGAVVGGADAAIGYNQAVSARRRSQRQIYEAYNQARAQQLIAQRQGRESTTENLIARGILSGGGQQGFARPADATPTTAYDPRQAAYTNGVIPTNPQGGIDKAINYGQRHPGAEAAAAKAYPTALDTTRSTPAQRKAQNYEDAIQGATGQANTLGGQTETDFSNQSYLAGTNLDAERKALYEGANVEGLQGEINAIGGGVSAGLSAYNFASGMGGGGALPSAASIPSQIYDPNYINSLGTSNAVNANGDHAFGVDAINPVNPSGKVSVGSFNVLGGGNDANKNAQGGL